MPLKDDEYIELIVRTSSGSIEASLKVPVASTPEQRDAYVKMWIDAVDAAMKLTRTPEAQP